MDLKFLQCDIQNAYLTAPCRGKIYFIAGPELGSDQGKIMIIRRALYGLKSSGAAFWSFFAEILHDMGYKPCRADQDVWLRSATTKDGFDYYEYILVYVDDLLHASHNPDESMQQIMSRVKLKNDHYGEPEVFLGSQLQWKNINGSECWTMTSNK